MITDPWTNKPVPAPPLNQWKFMVQCLSMGYGTHDSDVRWAFKCWGGLGFAGHRKRRRERLLALAEKMATEVGHGDTPRPMVILPPLIFLPMAFVEEAERRFGTRLLWETPTIREEHLCANCDGAPDGGHVGDALCARTLEEWTGWEYRPWR